MDIRYIYVDMLIATIYRQFSQFVHPVEGVATGWIWGIFILASCKHHIIRVHEILVQHPSNNKSNIINYSVKKK